VLVALCTLLGALGVVAVVHSFSGSIKLPQLGPACTVRADGEVTLDSVQMANAATITAVGVRRKMPERAVVIALATALQESKLENLEHGDRDSLGLFQQRPSQGWGTPEQVRDPRHSATRFYASLKKVKGWKKMRVTDAAQRVQRSAYPNAYQKWADEAEVLARALTGRATVLAVVLVALALAYTYPVRVYLAQESQIAKMQAAQAAQRALIADKQEEVAKWQDPRYVEIQARERLFYVLPGEVPLLVLNDPVGAARDAGEKPPAAAPDRWYDTLWSSVDAANSEQRR
jgi:cell division protein FtsB